tara:strand:- start:52 stop:1197 length:1146 start_codon:yes stop_codon:yes gene_type:complete
MKIIILGGDGFCGWPTSLRLAASGHEILIIDNLSRRLIDTKLSSSSLTEIKPIEERIQSANKHIGKIEFKNIDIAKDVDSLRKVILDNKPKTIIQFAEQRSAPYSMLSDSERRYTIENNILGTHNVCSAIVDINKDIHLVHLGTMGVYGYSKEFGRIPEGYLNVDVPDTGKSMDILYPTNPGSIYHLTKSLDQIIFQYYNKNWGLKITDLHQGIVWGIETPETKLSKNLINRFDYDGIYGTVLNRFITQAVNNHPLTVYGKGGQKRAFININDTAECIKLSVENDDFDTKRVRIFNQVSEVLSVSQIANIISEQYGSDIDYLDNPRKELAENELEVSNDGLKSLGFQPILLNKGLIEDIELLAKSTQDNFNKKNVLNSPSW